MLIYLLVILIVVLLITTFYFAYVKPGKDPQNRASELIRQNKLDEAIEEYRRILTVKPNSFKVHNSIADLYLKLENFEKAKYHLEEMLQINQFSPEVTKLSVYRKLAKAYYLTDDIEQAFQAYLNMLRIEPEDAEALYHISFISLGQEEFDISLRYFDKLVKVSDEFESYFGAGICNYQNKKYKDAAEHFREALAVRADSDITLLAVSFALWKNGKYNEAVSFLAKLAGRSSDENVLLISKRLMSFLLALAGKYAEALQSFTDFLQFVKEHDFQDEMKTGMYDMGFVLVKNDRLEEALKYWNELFRLDGRYPGLSELIEVLKKDVDKIVSDDGFDSSVFDYVDDWLSNVFPEDFLWNICGLKSSQIIDIRNIMTSTRVSRGPGEVPASKEEEKKSGNDFSDKISKFMGLETKDFKVLCNKVVLKLGVKIDEILNTYKDSDGVDMAGRSQDTGEKTLIWIRRWKGSNVGEITLRNFAQAINDSKSQKGYFITTADLTPPALNALKKLSKVRVVYPQDLNELLKGLI